MWLRRYQIVFEMIQFSILCHQLSFQLNYCKNAHIVKAAQIFKTLNRSE